MLSASQAWQLLRGAPFGRLAVVLDACPDIFPVNHVVDHGSVVFRTEVGAKLIGSDGQQVAYEADGFDVHAQTGLERRGQGPRTSAASAARGRPLVRPSP
ncbi:pyridoxamine 5'-phosphate oxidase family protein [Angustibacter sp. McL0619]|uniref:pyridoxamine 5'-phosphate oxidase family protein n=1 Tax=Angustibacter sp. McL0619 TaxID=3415676 RepID=UPI003CF7C938